MSPVLLSPLHSPWRPSTAQHQFGDLDGHGAVSEIPPLVRPRNSRNRETWPPTSAHTLCLMRLTSSSCCCIELSILSNRAGNPVSRNWRSSSDTELGSSWMEASTLWNSHTNSYPLAPVHVHSHLHVCLTFVYMCVCVCVHMNMNEEDEEYEKKEEE